MKTIKCNVNIHIHSSAINGLQPHCTKLPMFERKKEKKKKNGKVCMLLVINANVIKSKCTVHAKFVKLKRIICG